MDFTNLNKEELWWLLKDLKLYSNITNKLWYRWKRIFSKLINDKSYYLVEYYPYADLEFVFTKSLEIYKRFFMCTPSREEIIFLPKKSILWWIKVYKDDDVVDLSFEKVERNLKK
jgi:hypothetical protein